MFNFKVLSLCLGGKLFNTGFYSSVNLIKICPKVKTPILAGIYEEWPGSM